MKVKQIHRQTKTSKLSTVMQVLAKQWQKLTVLSLTCRTINMRQHITTKSFSNKTLKDQSSPFPTPLLAKALCTMRVMVQMRLKTCQAL